VGEWRSERPNSFALKWGKGRKKKKKMGNGKKNEERKEEKKKMREKIALGGN
jgi:hypothetical protein